MRLCKFKFTICNSFDVSLAVLSCFVLTMLVFVVIVCFLACCCVATFVNDDEDDVLNFNCNYAALSLYELLSEFCHLKFRKC